MQHTSWVEQFLDELDTPAASLRPVYQELQKNFVAAVDPVVELIMAARSRAVSESAFVVRQLLVRRADTRPDVVNLHSHDADGTARSGVTVNRVSQRCASP